MKSEEAAFSALIHCCRRKCCPLFSLLRSFLFATPQVCCHVSVIVPAFLPTDRMMKHFIFSSEDRTDLQSKPQNLCVINYIFIKLHFKWNKPKKVRTFSVPISCRYSVLNQRQIVLQKCVGRNVWSIRTPKKKNGILWNYHGAYYVWNVISFEYSCQRSELPWVRNSYCFYIDNGDFGFPCSCDQVHVKNIGFFLGLGGREGLGRRKLYKPFNDLANLALQTFILYVFRWE